MTDTSLKHAIIATVAYFDGSNYAPTLLELARYLWKHETASIGDILQVIDETPALVYEHGLICFYDRTELLAERNIRYIESTRKLHKRFGYVKALTYFPHVKAIFLVNSVAWLNAHEHSDVDLLIVSTPGKIWSTRFFTTLFAKLLGIRPRDGFTKDTLCLSFYLQSNYTNTQELMGDSDDIYEVYWHEQLWPLYDPQHFGERISANNSWLNEYVPNGYIKTQHPEYSINSTWLQHVIQKLFQLLSFEPLWKSVQLKILPQKLKDLAGPVESSVVVLSDTVLKFHTQDPRPAIKQRWLETIEKYS